MKRTKQRNETKMKVKARKEIGGEVVWRVRFCIPKEKEEHAKDEDKNLEKMGDAKTS